MLGDRYTILYLINPDPIFYGDLDAQIIAALEKQGARVIQTELDALSFSLKKEIKFYQSKNPIEFDGFLAYGYMSPKHYQDYYYLVAAVEAAGKTVLHSTTTEHILSNKLLQYVKFAEHKVSIPKTGVAFSIPSFKDILEQFREKAVMKEVYGYAGTGVELSKTKTQSSYIFAKSLWKGEQQLVQKFISDSIGRSIRVLVIGGKAVSVCEFQDNTDFKSNGYSDDFSMVSKMDSRLKKTYFEVAEKACESIDKNLTIGGVDILESKEGSMCVLEINSWPEMLDSMEATKLPLLDIFAQEFVRKVALNRADNN